MEVLTDKLWAAQCTECDYAQAEADHRIEYNSSPEGNPAQLGNPRQRHEQPYLGAGLKDKSQTLHDTHRTSAQDTPPDLPHAKLPHATVCIMAQLQVLLHCSD